MRGGRFDQAPRPDLAAIRARLLAVLDAAPEAGPGPLHHLMQHAVTDLATLLGEVSRLRSRPAPDGEAEFRLRLDRDDDGRPVLLLKAPPDWDEGRVARTFAGVLQDWGAIAAAVRDAGERAELTQQREAMESAAECLEGAAGGLDQLREAIDQLKAERDAAVVGLRFYADPHHWRNPPDPAGGYRAAPAHDRGATARSLLEWIESRHRA